MLTDNSDWTCQRKWKDGRQATEREGFETNKFRDQME